MADKEYDSFLRDLLGEYTVNTQGRYARTPDFFPTADDNVGSILPDDPTWRDSIRNILAESLGGERKNYRQAENLLSVGDFAPIVGGGLMTADVADQYDAGNYGTATTLAMLGAVPVAGPSLARGGKGLLSSAGNLINRVAQNVPTDIAEFYTNPVKGGINFIKEYGKSVAPAVKESIDPAAVAKRRVLGISDTKLDDWVSDVGQDAEKTAISINRQLDMPEDSLLEKSVVGLNYLDSKIPRADVATLSKGIGQGFRTTGKIPESIVERATKHLTDGPHIKKQNYRYDYQIKDPSVDKNVGYVESIGLSGGGAQVVRSLHGKSTDTYLKVVNNLRKSTGTKPKAKLDSEGMVEFMQIASTLNNNTYQLMKKLGVSGQPSQVVNDLLRARAKTLKGAKLKKGEQKVLDSFNKLLDTKAIKMARVSDEAGNSVGARNLTDIKKPEGYLVTQQSYNSRQKELGGVNAFVVVDPNKEKMYTMLSDGHDIFGKDPVGGHGLITVSPLIESSIKTGAKYNNKQIKTNMTKRKINKALKETEKVTGVKQLPKETNEAYTKRAMRLSKPQVTEADVARANLAKRKLQGTAGGVGLLTTAGVVSALEDEE